jgi:general secretion pathway protein L
MIVLDTPITMPLIGKTVSKAWDWWLRELLQAIPASLLQKLRPPRAQVDIYFTKSEAIVSQLSENGWEERGRLDLAPSTPDEAAFADFFKTASRPDVRVRLANALILRRELDLPRAAESRLRDIVAIDFDRQTPLTLETGVFDVQVRERDLASGRIRVALIAAKRRTINESLALCSRLGVFPRSITVADHADGLSEFNLLTPAGRGAEEDIWRRPWFMATVAIGVLVALNLTLAFERQGTRIANLSAELTKTRKAAQATEKLRSQLALSQAEARLLLESQSQAGPLEVIQELTRLLPDDVWLFGLEIRNGSVQIAGLSPSASDLIGRLDQSEIFTNPRFSAAVTRANKPGSERFEITLDLRGKEKK